MPYGEYAQCPCCGKTAYGKDNIEKNLVIVIWEMEELFHNLIAENVVLLVAKQDILVK